jgi:FkbM family methyltransferase
MYKVETFAGTFSVELENDFYGESYWRRVASNTYEPDTMSFLRNYVDSDCDFIDVGAANGAITLLAGALGASVRSYEAAPGIYEVAKRNIELNPQFCNEISIYNYAISSENGTLEFRRSSNKAVLSDIVFAGLGNEKIEIKVVKLSDVVNDFHTPSKRLVVKVDIEGAEWKILKDKETLEALFKHNAIVLLAIHPGFHRPVRSRRFAVKAIQKLCWQLRNAFEVYTVFKSLFKFALVKRTNFDEVKAPKKIVMLMFGGYFEFILEFGNHERF